MKDPKMDIHQPHFVRALFDKMSKTYGTTNYFSSFGFAEIWRRQCVQKIDWRGDGRTYDLMSGMGECWHLIQRQQSGPVIAVDISPKMNHIARRQLTQHPDWAVKLVEADVLQSDFPAGSADYLVCSFGLKHFSPEQLRQLARQVSRILAMGGQFSFLEVSRPQARWIRLPFMFYLQHIIPLIGKYFAGDATSYRYLGIYTEAFRDARLFAKYLRELGLSVRNETYFFGCATGVVGRKEG